MRGEVVYIIVQRRVANFSSDCVSNYPTLLLVTYVNMHCYICMVMRSVY